jgi:hypothetical protein
MKKWTNCTLISVLALSLLTPSASFAQTNENPQEAKKESYQYPVLTKVKKPEEVGFSTK